MFRRILTIVIVLYVVACVAALAFGIAGVLGWIGGESDPLAMVFAIALALPWPLLINLPGDNTWLNLALIVVYLAVNTGILLLIRRLVTRRA